MAPLRHVLFDLDGTLTDPAVGIFRSLGAALERMGLPVPAETVLRRCIGPPLQRSMIELLQVPRERLDEAISLYRERYGSQGQYENTPYPGIPELLQALQGDGLALWVATSKPAVFARNILAHFGLSPFFRGIWGSELDGTRSDKGDLLRHLLAQETIAPGEAVMVGDREHDVLGAARNGVSAIGVTWGYGSRPELISAGAVALAQTPAALLETLRPVYEGSP